jgi:uncharacterized membrane protein SirB2
MDILKTVHVTAALISISGFVLRCWWMLQESPRLNMRWVKIAPHTVDTILLVSAIMLALRIHQYPLTSTWLTAKVLALLVYIGLGMVALRFGKTQNTRAVAAVLAVLVFTYMVAVAVTRSALPGLS